MVLEEIKGKLGEVGNIAGQVKAAGDMQSRLKAKTQKLPALMEDVAKFYQSKGSDIVPTPDLIVATSGIINSMTFSTDGKTLGVKYPDELKRFIITWMASHQMNGEEQIYTLTSLLDQMVYRELMKS